MSSGETSSIIRRTVKRSVGGGIADGDNIEVIRNYQVYRGMSPNTSNRLEIRIRELEDALEQERQARLRAEQELSDITIELTTVTERLDEADGQNSAQSEFNRKRDAELLKLRKDYELLAVQHESELASLRKRHQEALNELADQLEHLNKNKGKFDKEKQTLIFEIESSNQALDSSNKARALAESKVEGLEDQLRRLKAQLDELTRQNNDLNSWKARLTQENFELHRQVQDLDSSAGSLNKAKAVLQAQIDELKSQLDDVSGERNALSMTVNNLQIELENASSKCDEESEAASSLRAQLQKALADLSHLKAKYDQDINIRLVEYEDAKRKTHARIVELEDLLEQAQSKAKKAESSATKLTIEIRDLYNELDQHQRLNADLNKRLKVTETSSVEYQSRLDDLNAQLQNAGGDCQRLQLEVTRLKQALQELQDKYDAAQRENKKLSDALREAQGLNKDLTRQVQDLLSIRAQLEAERDRLAVELSDAVDALKDAQGRLEASNAALNQLKIDFEHRLREKDEEIESSRKSGQRGIDELQKTVIEIENKYKNDIGKHKKKYDTDIREFEIQIDGLSRSNAELGKANKSLAVRVKELEVALDGERGAADEAKNALTVSERKRIALQTELEDLRALLEAAERARKNAEASLGDNSSRLNELNISITAAHNERKRLEGDLVSVQASLEEAHSARRASDERADRLQLEVNRLASELARAQENYAQADSLRKGLETEIREITMRLEEAETYAQKEGKRLVAKLQSRVRDLEAELEAEQRRSRDVMGENKKLARALAELRAQAEEDHRLVAELTDQINALQSKIALYKRQLLEADEVINITLSKYRKAQQQLEECERRAETAERNITIQVNRGVSVGHHAHHGSLALPPLGGSRARSMSVTRETHRVVRA